MTQSKSTEISQEEWFRIVCHDKLEALRVAWGEEEAAKARVELASEELDRVVILYSLTLPLRSLQRIPA